MRLREVEADPPRRPADLLRAGLRAGLVPAGHDDLAALVGVGLRELAAEPCVPPTTTTLPMLSPFARARARPRQRTGDERLDGRHRLGCPVRQQSASQRM